MDLLKIITQSGAVAKVSVWKDRHYVDLTGFNPRAAGDRSTKIWFSKNVLKIEGGKGNNSPDFLASLDVLRADLTAAGAVRASYADYAIEATYTMME